MAEPKPPRAARTKLKPTIVTEHDLIAAARALHRSLGFVVADMDAKLVTVDPKNVELTRRLQLECWRGWKNTEAPPTRLGQSRVSTTLQAIRLVAEQRVLGERRIGLGIVLEQLALRFVRGEIQPDDALSTARRVRSDGGPPTTGSLATLKGVLARHRSEPARWAAAYAVLAEEADVVPLPVVRKGLRNDLKRDYEGLTRKYAPSPELLQAIAEHNQPAPHPKRAKKTKR